MTENLQGDVYLIPLPIGSNSPQHFHTPYYLELIPQIRYWISEDARTLRRYISSLKLGIEIDELEIFESNHRTPEGALSAFLELVPPHAPLGVVSEAGIPCIADPGNKVVQWAHRKKKPLHPIMGPNSIIMAIQTSGLSGQEFIFHGYPPVHENELKSWLKNLFIGPWKKYTHCFIETPYRSDKTYQNLVRNLPDNVTLSVASQLHEPDQQIVAKSISEWKKTPIQWGKTPAVWVLGL
jgi:16S rRNA (cytidine1402-2'-O)-methyltransferase